jgi:hypothetical protein
MILATVLEAIKLVGSATPAFDALFHQVLPLFGHAEQRQLKDAYAAARQSSDDAQDDFVRAGRGG